LKQLLPAALVAAVLAALVPAIVATLALVLLGRAGGAAQLWTAFSLALWIGLALSVPFGLPVAWLLRRRGRFGVAWLVVAGAVLGALGMAVWSWPVRFGDSRASVWIDGQQLLSAGMPTAAGWWTWLTGVCWFAALGALGGAAFWGGWRMVERSEKAPEHP
jgi:hypothetical protein